VLRTHVPVPCALDTGTALIVVRCREQHVPRTRVAVSRTHVPVARARRAFMFLLRL
jgi:hypothetical protein